MSWSDIKNKLLEAAQSIKENKILDATVEVLLSQIPVVGPFASKYWSIIEGDGAAKAEIVSKFLEMAAQQEEQFENLGAIISEQGEILLQNKASLDDIRTLLSERLKTIEDKLDNLTSRFDFMLQHLRVRTVSEAFATSVVLQEDRRKAEDLISEAEEILEKAGKRAEPSTYYQLGMIYLTLNRFENAQASFLAAIKANPEMGEAYVGLGITHQLHANEMIRHENFGLAEEGLSKAERYIKTAWQYNSEDPHVDVQLGYIQKELAQRYFGTGKHQKAQTYLQKAETNFKRALGVDENNASAYNGLGNIYYLRADYDHAIQYSGKATELYPKYLFAYFDLTMAFYGKARIHTISKEDRLEALRGLLAASKSVGELHGTDAGSLPPGALENLVEVVKWAAQEAEWIRQQ